MNLIYFNTFLILNMIIISFIDRMSIIYFYLFCKMYSSIVKYIYFLKLSYKDIHLFKILNFQEIQVNLIKNTKCIILNIFYI